MDLTLKSASSPELGYIPPSLFSFSFAAIPDFAAGAMENWGLVCFRDTALLLDQNSSSAAAFQAVAETVSHELAHQVGSEKRRRRRIRRQTELCGEQKDA